jgi:hypothetical protein
MAANDLESWLGAIKCGALLGPLQELGAEGVDDLLDLEPEDVTGLVTQLKKIQANKFNKALKSLQDGQSSSPQPELTNSDMGGGGYGGGGNDSTQSVPTGAYTLSTVQLEPGAFQACTTPS